jgi:hypothetical protein
MNMNKPKYMLPGMEGSDPKVLALEALRIVFADTTEGVAGLLLVCSEIQKAAQATRKPGETTPLTERDIIEEHYDYILKLRAERDNLKEQLEMRPKIRGTKTALAKTDEKRLT